MNTRSLRFQLLAWYTSLLSIAFAALGLFLFIAVKQLLLQNLRDILSKRARQIAHLSAEADQPLTSDWLRGQIGTIYAPETPESNGRFVRVTTADGVTVFLSGMPADGSFDPAKFPLIADLTDGFRVENSNGNDVIVRSLHAETKTGPVVIEVGGAISPIETSIRHILFALLVAAPCLITIATVGAYSLIGRALHPVIRLAKSAEAISLQNLDERLPVVHTGDELETLSIALNRMISRLHDAVEATRRFIADASHELRTPLAVLRGELENMLHQEKLDAPVRRTLASNLEEVERLGKIVQGLFAMSRLDCGEAQMESISFDLSKITATTTEQMCLLAEDKGISLICSTPEPALVRGDPARVKQVIVNLLDNAINHTNEGGLIKVSTFAEKANVVLEVSDNGVGIPSSALPHIFERFYRADKTRSRELGGAGLGLSIVKSICAAHSAEIKVQSTLHLGTKFHVCFPPASVGAMDASKPNPQTNS